MYPLAVLDAEVRRLIQLGTLTITEADYDALKARKTVAELNTLVDTANSKGGTRLEDVAEGFLSRLPLV